MSIELVNGDLTNCAVDAIINPWNRQVVPWWLLSLHGVAGRIKRRAGSDIFRELARQGRLSPGQAVLTKSGNLPCRYIIHVAGIGLFGHSDAEQVRLSTRNALAYAARKRFTTLAFPLIGAGSGGLSPLVSYRVMLEELAQRATDFRQILVVVYEPKIFEVLKVSNF